MKKKPKLEVNKKQWVTRKRKATKGSYLIPYRSGRKMDKRQKDRVYKKAADPMQEALLRAAEGGIEPTLVEPLAQQMVSDRLMHSILSGKMKPHNAADYYRKFSGNVQDVVSPAEDLAYRKSQGSYVPTTMVGTLGIGSAAVGGTLGAQALAHKFKGAPRPTLGGAASVGLGPAALAPFSIYELIGLLANPSSDPKHLRGERGYFSSVLEGLKGQTEQFGEKVKSVRDRYGPVGLPINALQGIMSPVTGTSYALMGLKRALIGE